MKYFDNTLLGASTNIFDSENFLSYGVHPSYATGVSTVRTQYTAWYKVASYPAYAQKTCLGTKVHCLFFCTNHISGWNTPLFFFFTAIPRSFPSTWLYPMETPSSPASSSSLSSRGLPLNWGKWCGAITPQSWDFSPSLSLRLEFIVWQPAQEFTSHIAIVVLCLLPPTTSFVPYHIRIF